MGMSDGSGIEPGRLNGWREIAGHLGKGARTVQRWEKLYGLPVHRIGREGGEVVYAFRDEIDRWMKSGAAGRASSRRVGRWLVAVLLLAGTAAALVLVSRLRPASRAGQGAPPLSEVFRQPAGWRLANESLIVFDAAGAPLFEHRFDYPLLENQSSDTAPAPPGQPPVLIADLEGDGRTEVLVRGAGAERTTRRLYCFEADGRLRFTHQPTGGRRYGNEDYAEPWLAFRVFLTQGPGGAKRLWSVFVHNLLFPTVLQELDPRDGAVRQEYWSDGYIEVVREVSWNGRPTVLVGGTNNDFRAASLAVFPPDGVKGSTPAVRPRYACQDCPRGGPETLFIFPTLCLSRLVGQAGVHDLRLGQDDRLRVSVAQGTVATGEAFSFYTLGPDGGLLGAEISGEFQAQHALLERQGVLDHPFGPLDDRDMFPVRRWDGRRFVELPRVPVAH
jgi:hypothetical protein